MAFAYNTALHRSIKATPFFLTYGIEPRLPAFPTPDLRRYYGQSDVAEWFATLQHCRQLATHHNIGAGTITCNYDGANKHRTVIGDNVHIGSDVQLIAPVTINTGATIGAGTTVWKDAAAASLIVNPKTQAATPNWQRPAKKIKN